MTNRYDFTQIFLMWRLAKGHRRICIGVLSVPRNAEKGISFKYLEDGIKEAQKEDPSFCGYPGIPIEQKNIPSEQLEEVFYGRLINNSRSDADTLYKFWLVDERRINDKLYVLAQTQGLSINDTFEFVPQFFNNHKPSFITDIAGLSHSQCNLSSLKKGDILTFTREEDNKYDSNAVKISFYGEKIGYIKKGHNTVFSRKHTKGIKVSVWDVITFPGFEKLYVRIDIK